MKDEAAHAFPSPREQLHIAMAEIVKAPLWWNQEEARAIGIAIKASHGTLDPKTIQEEFRALRVARGLPAIRPAD